MRMYLGRSEPSTGRLTRRAHPQSYNTLRLDVPVGSFSTPSFRPQWVLGTGRKGGTPSTREEERTTHQALVA
jgi:hypothetical protein